MSRTKDFEIGDDDFLMCENLQHSQICSVLVLNCPLLTLERHFFLRNNYLCTQFSDRTIRNGHLGGQKILDFWGQDLQMALVIHFARRKIIKDGAVRKLSA